MDLLDITLVLRSVDNFTEYEFAVSEANKRDEIYINLPCGKEYESFKKLMYEQSNILITNCKQFLHRVK